MCYNTAAMKKYTCVLFDLDGTLTYSHPGIYGCIRYALQQLGKEEAKMEQLRKCIGPSLMYSFQNYFGMDEETARLATAKYRERYAVEGWAENAPIEGALETLKALKQAGYKLAMATSKPLIYAEKISAKFGFSDYFDAEVGSGLDGSFPTKASVIEEAMKRLGGTAEKCLMVGDRKHDAEGAKENGVDCALLKVGYAENEEEFISAAPEYVFDSFEELKMLLL
ncbi:MAG: HAD hydrolase-like protein [Clostridia bacterium]|nr:HAD hydrolase-like protein [Clostridia bacterium]